MLFNSILFFISYLVITSLSIFCLLNMFALNTTFKILFNMLCFILCNAFTLILLGLDFFGIVYAIVYAGAILVLFLSVLMLIDLRAEDTAEILAAQTQKKKKIVFLQGFILLVYVFSLTWVYFYLFNLYTDESKNLLEADLVVPPTSVSVFHSRNIIYWISEVIYTSEVTLFLTIGAIFFLALVGSISLVLNEYQKVSAADSVKEVHIFEKK